MRILNAHQRQFQRPRVQADLEGERAEAVGLNTQGKLRWLLDVHHFVRFGHLGRRPLRRHRRRPGAAIRAPLINSRAGQKPPDVGPAHFRVDRRPFQTAGAGAKWWAVRKSNPEHAD
jgi:hypothetical protein